MLVEHARNVVGIADATHAEYGAPGTHVVTLLACSLYEQTVDVRLAPASHLAELHGTDRSTERTTCNYGLEPSFAHIASAGGMAVAAIDATGEVRAIERPDHPFFVATLYQPQLSSTAGRPHPVWSGLVAQAVAQNRATSG